MARGGGHVGFAVSLAPGGCSMGSVATVARGCCYTYLNFSLPQEQTLMS
jgi:hypothetical protein